MTPFFTPSRGKTYLELGIQAVREALEDSSLGYAVIEQAFAGFVYADSTAGQRVLYGVGMTGIPIVNVNNNCSTGSSALYLARQAILSGECECALAVGFEQMVPGAIGSVFTDRPTPFDPFLDAVKDIQGYDPTGVMAAQLFGGAGAEYAREHNTPPEIFARISVKARRHARDNPRAVFREPLTVEEVLAAKPVFGPLTRVQCCPPTSGAAAAVLCTPEFAAAHGVRAPVAILAQALTTDRPSTFGERKMGKLVGWDMTRAAADAVYAKAGVGPEDLDVVELHDCFTANELVSYEALRLTPEGTAERFIADEQNTYGGSCVTNPSGGLLAKGHPLGATGLAQCAELVWQIRGEAGGRQVRDARLALQHNLGLGGACVVTLFGAT
jgi:acetyl-CoA acetyltransferase